MTSESVEELVLTDSWAGRHEHVHDDSVDVFIPRWVFWSLGGALVGAIAWLVWVEYQAEKSLADRVLQSVLQQRDAFAKENLEMQRFIRAVDPVLQERETDKAAPDENAQETPNL